MDVIIAAIVFAVVIIAALINTKMYNIIHGFLTLFGISSLLYLIYYVGTKAGSAMTSYANAIAYVVNAFELPLLELFTKLNLTFMASTSKPAFYLIPIAAFIISFILASMLRHIKKRRD